jgi:hypothetical protein
MGKKFRAESERNVTLPPAQRAYGPEGTVNSCMKLRVAVQRTAEQENIEPQNIEGWNRYALSFESIKLDRIPSFDIRYSIFIVRYSLFYPRTRCRKAEVSFSIKLVT